MSDRFTQTFTLNSAQCDLAGRWTAQDIMVQFQEISGAHSALLGCGRQDLIDRHNAIWILTRSELHMLRTPCMGETVTLETYTHAPRRIFHPRSYRILDAQNRLCGEALSYWVVCDIAGRKIVSLPDVTARIPDSSQPLPFRRFMDPPAIGAQAVHTARIPRYSDLDVNGHVNNTRYLSWLCDLIGTETMRTHSVSRFLIDYHHEILPTDEMDLALSLDGSDFALTGTCRGTLYFSIAGSLSESQRVV